MGQKYPFEKAAARRDGHYDWRDVGACGRDEGRRYLGISDVRD